MFGARLSQDARLSLHDQLPDIVIDEQTGNLGILGDVNEPLLALALQQILLDRKVIKLIEPIELIDDSNKFELLDKEMYIDMKNVFLIKK